MRIGRTGKVVLVALAVVMAMSVAAFAIPLAVFPTVTVVNSPIVAGQAAALRVAATSADPSATPSFDGTLTLESAASADATIWASVRSRFSTQAVEYFYPKPTVNTWYRVAYAPTDGEATTSAPVFQGVKANLFGLHWTHGGRRGKALYLTGKVFVGKGNVPVAEGLVVTVTKATGKGRSAETTAFGTFTGTLTKQRGASGTYIFKVLVPTTSADKGATLRPVVTYDDDTHELATARGAGRNLWIRLR